MRLRKVYKRKEAEIANLLARKEREREREGRITKLVIASFYRHRRYDDVSEIELQKRAACPSLRMNTRRKLLHGRYLHVVR